MGNRVTSFFNELGQSAKTVWSDTQKEFLRPVLGDLLSDRLGLANRRNPWDNQIGTLILAKGGMVEEDVKEINTQAQLIDLIKKFPEEAARNGLSVELVKQEAKQLARGGRLEVEMPERYARGGHVFRPNKLNDSVF